MVGLRMDHDENQFVASGALLARCGLLPYRDYPYFHVPYLVFVYAEIFQFSDRLLLAARSFSVICGTATVVAVLVVAHRILNEIPKWRRWFFAISTCLLFMANPLFAVTSGRAWNHDLPTLLTLCVFLIISQMQESRKRGLLAFFAGCLSGLCMGVRITFAPSVVGFALAILLLPNVAKPKRKLLIAAFAAGVLIALLPLAAMFAIAPHQMIFGVIRYPFLNLLWRDTAPLSSMSVVGKFEYPFTNILNRPGSGVVALLFLAAIWKVVVYPRLRGQSQRFFEFNLLMIIVVALLIGALVPTPSFVQYFYSPIPFVLLMTIFAVRSASRRQSQVWLFFFGMATLVAVGFGLPAYRGVLSLFSPDQWAPMQVHRIGNEIANATDHGRVLTLATIFPLEGGAQTYEEFATGPFAFRIAPLVSEESEEGLKLLDEDDLETALHDRPPTAVLLPPRHHQFDQPFIDYAHSHHLPIYVVLEEPERADGPAWQLSYLSLHRK